MVTDESLDKFGREIIKAAEMLQVATLSLRSLYVVNSSSVDSFVKLRQKITNKATVYSEKVLPSSNDLIRTIQNFFEYYGYIQLNKFIKFLRYFTREAKQGVELCKLTLKLYNSILVEFKNSEDEVIKVLDQLKLGTQEYERKKKELKKSADVKLSWAIGLALVPVINVIASPILYMKSNELKVREIAASEEELLTVAAAEAIKGPLIISITNLVNTFKYISEFFIALTDELTNLNDDESKTMLYNRMKDKSPIIIEACSIYFSKLPDVETNLQAIPDDYDKNYVAKWLSERS